MEALVEDIGTLILWAFIGIVAFTREWDWVSIFPMLLTVLSVAALITHTSNYPVGFLEALVSFGFSSLRGKMLSTPAYLIGANIGGGLRGMRNLPSLPQILLYFLIIFVVFGFVPPIE
jgi:hypothetical protein